jgi:tetratricopeptide (TPR) repeat protein
VQADAAAIRGAAAALAARAPNEGLEDEARYAFSVAADLDGDHEEALLQARDLARNESTNMGRRAALYLDNPEADRFKTLREAVRQHRRQRLRYVFLGKRPSLPGTLRSAARTGLGGLQAAQTLGVFNVVGVLTRAIGNWRSDPIPNDAIVAAGEDFVAREPNSPNVSAVRHMLAAAYEREGQYERALFHVERAAEPDRDRIHDLTEKAAERTRRMAEATPSPTQRRILFAMIGRQYPDTRAATKAEEALQRLGTGDGDAPTLSAGTLRADAALSDRLGLPAAWRDGQPANGEIGGAGLRLVSPDRAVLTLDTPDGPVEQPIVLDEQRTATLGAALDEAAYREAEQRSRRDRTAAPLAHLIPFYLQGTVGESGIAVFPGIKPREHTTENRDLYGE